MADNNPERPDYRRRELIDIEPSLQLMRDLLGGTDAMHANAKTYVRQWADEEPAVWKIRSKCEQLYEATGRTLSAAVGMIYAKPPSIDYPEQEALFEGHWGNINGSGDGGAVFLKKFTEVASRDGVSLILVDMPPSPVNEKGGPVEVTSEMESELDLYPHWGYYHRSQIYSWWVDTMDNRRQVVQLVLWEPTPVPDKTFGVKVVNRYRVLRVLEGVAYWSVYEEVAKAGKGIGDFALVGAGVFRNRNGELYDRLPIGVAHTGRSDALLGGSIPLLGVAQMNLGHYQLSTNVRFYADLLAFPQPTVIGEMAQTMGSGGQLVPGKLKLGPMVVVRLTGENASYSFTSPGPEAFAPLDTLISRKERQLGQLGMSFLAGDTRQAETAEAKRMDATAENATLSTVAQGIEDAANEAWKHHAWYEGVDVEGAPRVGINRDFEQIAMDPQTMLAYVTAIEKAGLPGRLLLEEWQKGGRIAPDVDLDELELEMMAAQAAKEEAEREARENALEAALTKPPAGGGPAPNPDPEIDPEAN